ncbi:hypothetical protein TEA_029710 [Camellia sinensis var. sinensis]|uniref:Uncharacterized protein n=1 Tax=Camellia sinensis var. sinensis TaxID=542762 RepID=A0A4S4EFS0_CAMSN|nr:hypothetical protein TEA_029710 [Camellia sinensis var. sinensis]
MDVLNISVANTSIALAFASVLLLYYLLHRSKTSKAISPPEAGGAWPILGHLHLLGGSQLPHKTLASMSDKYGPIFTIRLGLHRAVVVSNWEIAKECFTTHDIAVSSRPKFIAAEHLGYNYAMLAFSPYGSYWRELRKIISLELVGHRRLEQFKHVRVSETDTAIKELHKVWREKRDSSGTIMVEMKQWFADLTLNVVVRMVAGKRYFGSGSGGDDEEEARRCQKAFRDFFKYLGLFLVSDAFPFLRWLDLGGHEKAMKETAKEMDCLVGGWLEEHRRKRDSGDSNDEQDFMDVMLSTLEDTDLAGYDIDVINKATCLVLITGGADTTASNVDMGTLITNEQSPRVKESSRRSGHPHRDPTIWPEPSEFRPERFLTSHKHVDVKGQHFELIPFGAGRRVCPGTSFGVQMLHLVLARFLHGFELSTPSNALIDMTESAGLTNLKVTPLEVLVTPRLSPNLY